MEEKPQQPASEDDVKVEVSPKPLTEMEISYLLSVLTETLAN